MQKISNIGMIFAICVLIQSCTYTPTTSEENLIMFYRGIIIESGSTWDKERYYNVTIEGLSTQNNLIIRKEFFKKRRNENAILCDVTGIEDRPHYRHSETNEHASEIRIKIVEWFDQDTALIEISNNDGPLMGGGGTYKIQFDGKEWKISETISSWIS